MSSLLLVLLACGGDPELRPYGEALEAFEAGRAALGKGQAAEAAADFARAREHDPRSVPLRLWEAKALAQAGRLDDADARMSELLAADPSIAIAWYDRAAWRARAGRMEDAASDLAKALSLGATSPIEAAADPDFAAARSHPAFAGILPAQPLEASLHGTEGALFVGSRYEIELSVTSLPDASLAFERAGADPGCLRLSRIVEDDHAEEGRSTRVLTVELDAVGPCVTTVGPFTVRSGAASVDLPAVPVEVEAPPGAVSPTLPPLPTILPFPSASSPPDAGFAAQRTGDGVVAMGRVDRHILGGGNPPDVGLEWRVDGQPRAAGGWWRSAEPVALAAEGWEERL